MGTRVMPHLTVNQAMVLLDIYRGTLEFDRHTGTVEHDIRMLIDKEYVQGSTPEYVPTMLGEERVKMMLN